MIRDGELQFHDALGPLLVPIDDVKQHPENYNNGDTEGIAVSMKVNGMYRPIFAQTSTGYIIAGNHTWEAAAMLGATKIPVVWLDVTNTEAKRLMLADNRYAAKAMPDHYAEVSLMKQIMEADPEIGLEGTGYNLDELLAIQKLSEMPLEEDEFGQWPTFTAQVHPRVLKAFRSITKEADTDRDRFELVIRLAGWDGS